MPSGNATISFRRPLALIIFLSANALLFALLARRSPQVTLDTASYLSHTITRTPGYPVYLDLMGLLWPGQQMKLAQVVQLIAGFLTAFHLAHVLRRRLGLSAGISLLVYGLLLVPQVRLGQVICTESLSYSLLLALLGQLFCSFFELRLRQVLAVAALLLGLLLVRPQFAFLLPLAVLYLGWLFVGRQRLYDKVVSAGALAVALCASLLFQAAHNYAYNGRFARIPFTGIQVLSVALYFAEPADGARLSSEREARYLAAVFDKLDKNRWHGRYRASHQSIFEHFNAVYPDVCYAAVVPAYLPIVGASTLGPDQWTAMDGFTLRIALQLIRLHKKDFAMHVLKQIQDTGGYLPVLMLLMAGLGWFWYYRTGAVAALLPVTAGLMGWSNYLLVSLVEPLGTRYLIYTENIQLPILLAFIAHIARPRRSVPLWSVPQGLDHHLHETPMVHNEIAQGQGRKEPQQGAP